LKFLLIGEKTAKNFRQSARIRSSAERNKLHSRQPKCANNQPKYADDQRNAPIKNEGQLEQKCDGKIIFGNFLFVGE
jgi:hypothetical protein